MTTYTDCYCHEFTSIEDMNFSARDYSRLKFGSDIVARQFGRELADKFFESHSDELLIKPAVVIPSPYNYVPNAATIMTQHFVDRLNEHLVNANGSHVEYMTIPRKVSYINDYGFLSKEKRKSLIDNDKFYLNSKYLKGKILIFVDDVKITGTHEQKLVEILAQHKMSNRSFFTYYASYKGSEPDIESKINFASVNNLADYTQISHEDGHHLIVRPIKYLLTRANNELVDYLKYQKPAFVMKLYHACLGEGYYRIPVYQENFNTIKHFTSTDYQAAERVGRLMERSA